MKCSNKKPLSLPYIYLKIYEATLYNFEGTFEDRKFMFSNTWENCGMRKHSKVIYHSASKGALLEGTYTYVLIFIIIILLQRPLLQGVWQLQGSTTVSSWGRLDYFDGQVLLG